LRHLYNLRIERGNMKKIVRRRTLDIQGYDNFQEKLPEEVYDRNIICKT
jgi:hypothetical protein